MRVETQLRLHHRALFSAVGFVTGMKLPDVAIITMHRPQLFGRAFGRALQSTMRGESEWTVGERELFASYTALLQECEF